MPRRDLRITIALAVAAVMLIAATAVAQIEKGKKAPDFTLKTLDGKDFKLKSLVAKGPDQKKVIVLTFWGSWCPPCRAEAPQLQKLYEKYKSQGLEIVGVAVQDDPLRARRFVDNNKLTYTILLDNAKKPVADTYDAPPIPMLYVLDSEGIVRHTHLGYSPGAEKGLDKEIKDLLGDKGGAESP